MNAKLYMQDVECLYEGLFSKITNSNGGGDDGKYTVSWLKSYD